MRESLSPARYPRAIAKAPSYALATALLVGLTVSACAPSAAETIAFKCTENDAGDPKPEMTVTYEGDDKGTLKIKASYGEMSLPATKEVRDAVSEAGEKYSVTGIRAFGPATVIMPDKASIEACIKGKLKPEELTDVDMVTMALLSCRVTAPPSKEPVAIKAKAEIALFEPPTAEVFVTRTYEEPTTLPAGSLDIESFPPPSCTFVQ
jgi:hypothetical protein